ncbi:MAG: molybdopterin-binding protein, partial [Anaerovoracaceae bacterium]
KLAGTRVIPLVIKKEKLEEAAKVVGEKPLLDISPFVHKKVGIIVTGSEVFQGRIKDQFGPALERKLADFDVELLGKTIIGDDPWAISAEINRYLDLGAEMILCTGGMSVDPDDTTPTAIKNTGANIITYGAPVLPGAMFLLAYTHSGVPIMGLPGCVMYSRRTIFDLVLPKIMADEVLSKEDLSRLGVGGLCLDCEVCIFPNCGFGR